MALTKDELRKLREDTEKGKKADAVILSKNELDRIKGAAVVTDKEEQLQRKKILEE